MKCLGWTVATLLLAAGQSSAQSFDRGGFASGDEAGAFAPRVPVSAFARPAAWLDPSRLKISTTVSVGTGWGGRTEGLQVTSLSYQVAAPLALRLSLGNAFGAAGASRGNGFFLEGLQLAYRPHPSLQIHVDYRDYRSRLQYPSDPTYGLIGR